MNGKRHGKGKEYYNNGNIKFEGEYLNGKRNGKGKEYYYNGKIKFNGEYFNNKKWEGQGYDQKGNIIYELNNGNGIIKEYNAFDILLFQGEYLNGVINGKGKEYDFDGNLIYNGEYFNLFKL